MVHQFSIPNSKIWTHSKDKSLISTEEAQNKKCINPNCPENGSGLLGTLLVWIQIWILFEVNSNRLDPFLDPEGQPDPFEPKIWFKIWSQNLVPKFDPKIGLNLKKQVGFGRTTHHRWLYDMIDGPIRKSCQKFVHSFVNNECHEKDETIDNGVNDGDCKSWLVFIQVKISTRPR